MFILKQRNDSTILPALGRFEKLTFRILVKRAMNRSRVLNR